MKDNNIVGQAEFRKNMKLYLDQAEQDQNVMVVRNSKTLFSITKITPRSPDQELLDSLSSEELFAGIREDIHKMFAE